MLDLKTYELRPGDRGTVVLTIPARWMKKNELEAGDVIHLFEDADGWLTAIPDTDVLAGKLKDIPPTSPEYMTILSRTFYAIQKQRIEAGNRIAMNVRDQRLTEDEAALLNAHLKVGLHAIEKNVKRDMTRVLELIPIYQEWFKKIRGVGPLLAGAIIGEIGTIDRFEHISNLWSWAGFGIHDGVADRRRAGEKSHWNPVMKIVGWKAGKSFVKLGGYFRQSYDQFKLEEIAKNTPWAAPLESAELAGFRLWLPDGEGSILTKDIVPGVIKAAKKAGNSTIKICRTDGHVDNRANRRNIKLFLGLTWMKWRELEGLSVSEPYVAKVGLAGHHTIIYPDEVVAAEEALQAEKKAEKMAEEAGE